MEEVILKSTLGTSLLLTAIIVVVMARRQLQREKLVKETANYRGLIILLAVGVYQIYGLLQKHPDAFQPLGTVLVVVSMAIGIGIGIFRARFVHIWRKDGKIYTQGNWTSVGIWIVGIALHFSLEFLLHDIAPKSEELASSTIMLYLILSSSSEKWMVRRRAQSLTEQAQ